MIIGYARVSTDEQSLALQRSALLDAGCDSIHEDRGISGKQRSRPGLSTALSGLSAGDTLVVWRLDRLGRSLGHLISMVNQFDKREVNFRSLTENIDTTSSSGRLVFHIMGAMAEFERSLISERTRAGMNAARNQGRHIGRPPSLNAVQRQQVWQAMAMGISKRDIARRHGVSIRTLERLIHQGTKLDCSLVLHGIHWRSPGVVDS